jgi:hypothetical protein
MMPEPMTTARRKAVPRPSATKRRGSDIMFPARSRAALSASSSYQG